MDPTLFPPAPVKALGLYVHVPFCATTCDFCAFYQTTPTADQMENYFGAIAAELALVPRQAPVDTVFWGGGTPGLLGPEQIRRLGNLVHGWTGGRPEEWSVEMAPASVTKGRLRALKDIGVTRISMGAQSFQPAVLEGLGRQHTVEQIERAWGLIQEAEFASVNIDLMFALPGQDTAAWQEDLARAMAMGPDHISTYCLTFEEDTALWVKLSQGKVKLDPEREARLYEKTWAQLEHSGFVQYEVSNFAKPGHICRHNLNTWHMQEWVGVGPSAASQYNGWRGRNVSDLTVWADSIRSGRRADEDAVPLTADLLAEDALIFGLRLNSGVDTRALEARFPGSRWAGWHALFGEWVADGLAVRQGDIVRLTPPGRLLADAVGASILDVAAPTPFA